MKPEDWANIESRRLDITTANDPKLIKCQCGNVMEINPGKVDYNMKDEKGVKLTKHAAEHFAQNRIRCGECAKNFCSNCVREPYHLGQTCEEASKFEKARKCRFCKEEIRGPPPNMIPAFKDVCRKADCIELMNKSCDKTLPCGHYCKGFKGETECLGCLEPECIEKYNK